MRDVSAEALAAGVSVETEERDSVLRALAVPRSHLDIPVRCAGVLVPHTGEGQHADCPATPATVVFLSAPRRQSSAVAACAGVAAAATCSITRVVIVRMGPNGKSAEARDYVLEQVGSCWRYLRSIGLGTME